MTVKNKDKLAVIFLLLVGLLFFFDVLFLGRVFYAGDNLSINVPSKVLLLKMLQQGQLPLWNPYIFSGAPFLADINLGLLSPFNIFYAFLSPLRALTISIVLEVLFAGICMYWYARLKKLSLFASSLSAMVFMFSGTVMTHTMNTAILNTIVWTPLLFITLELLFQKKQIKYALFASIILALSFYGGHVQYFYYIALFSLGYILFQAFSLKEKIKHIVFIYIPFIFLSAVQLVPFLEYTAFSTRPIKDLLYAGSVSVVSFIHLILPNFFGVMKSGTSWGATADINGYVGIIPLILSLFILTKHRKDTVLFFFLAGSISFLIALGKNSPFYLAAFYILPFFSRFRSPTSILFLYTFSISILSGYGFEHLFKELKKKDKLKDRLIGVSVITSFILFIFLYLARITSFNSFVLFIKWINNLHQTSFLNRFFQYSQSRMHIIFDLWISNAAVLFLFIFLFSFFLYVIKRQKCILPVHKLLFILLVAADLFMFSSNNYIVFDEKALQSPRKIVDFLKKDKSNYRVLTMIDLGAKPPFTDPTYFPREAIKALDFFQANTNMLHEIQIVSGYASIVNKQYSDYISYKKSDDPTGITLPRPSMPELDELGVKYVITAGRYRDELEKNNQYKMVFAYTDPRIERTFYLYKNLKMYPRVFVLNEKNEMIGKATIASYTPNKVVVRVESPHSGRLVLTDVYYPGWNAYVDGKKEAIQKYKIFKSALLKQGTHVVHFVYKPNFLYSTAFVSIVNWLYILGFLLFILIKEHKNVSQPLHIGKSKIKQKTK